jgi:hypothetical protein
MHRRIVSRKVMAKERFDKGRFEMARIAASVYTSHVPAIGAALDLGNIGEPYWQKNVRRL